MAKPIWTGAISFGLLNIPVQLMPAERRVDLHFRLLDSRDNKRVRYERVNAETGDEVPWKDVVKAYEYDKGSYVVLEEEDLKKAAPESKESVDIESFIDVAAIGPQYFEKPYFLVPTRKSEKGYVLLRETLREQKKAGLARVVIRTREYLALVMVQDQALMLMLLRYPQELVAVDEYAFPEKTAKGFRIAAKELEMAEQLVKSMTANWNPKQHKDEFRERLNKVIQARIGKKKVVKNAEPEDEGDKEASTNVVDFMSLLKKSLDQGKRTPPARKAPAKKAASKTVARKRPAAKRRAAK